MTSRVLVADDSLTIQKVIGITLANSGYELVECVNEEELFRKIESNHFDLILLDFNLSDSRSGYELSKQINNVMPGAAIIVMLGTFDSIDEGQFASCGISDKIVKPFESSKFIKKCRDLLEGVRPTPVSLSEKKSFDEPATDFSATNSSDDLDLWTVDAPAMKHTMDYEPTEPAYGHETKSLDPLSSEIEGWGFAQPNNLEDKFQKSFPPVIEESENVLDRLQSSSTFMLEENETVDHDETDPSFEVPVDLKRNLLTEIDEEISAEAFWAVDEIVPVKAEEYTDIVETNLDEVTADLTETVQAFKESEKAATKVVPATHHEDADTIIHMDQDELVEKLKISLRPMIEEMVREFCRQSAEKVAWEVIPDLAENLIRKEIKDISDSVQH
ncbi:response regulator [Bacteriovorax sp. PP10]|uniref:Response regulator n=1 Tax=Bacteriovorax antarcticus TaxID=3088717 RepID=A0ABU5VPP0_9BACT|nr:response regulator [Bacteriovorax sp. PP10]MEA9355011.1 response regulator [Bacteriovorax sp. PP10]